MTKAEFLASMAKLYRFCNAQDHADAPERADWTVPEMAGTAGCAKFDQMLRELVQRGVLTEAEHQTFIDTI